MGAPKKPLTIESFMRRVRKTPACWIWTGVSSNGYGRAYDSGRLVYAHRVAYMLFVGAIPDGLSIDHLCRNKLCVNPRHLEAVTTRENIRRGIKGVLTTHCPAGHEYLAINTWLRPNGHRVCLKCKRASEKRRYHLRRIQNAEAH